MRAHGFGDLLADCPIGVERRQCVLEDETDVAAADAAQRFLRRTEQVLPVEMHLAAERRLRAEQPHGGKRQRALA
jgi:hypothetical protein